MPGLVYVVGLLLFFYAYAVHENKIKYSRKNFSNGVSSNKNPASDCSHPQIGEASSLKENSGDWIQEFLKDEIRDTRFNIFFIHPIQRT